MATWHFRPKQPGEKERNPVIGEYFDEEAIDRPAQAMVREVIQNSLDARESDDAVVFVRFLVSGPRAALPADRADHWLGGAWTHFAAGDSGLRHVEARPQRCPFVVVEDFHTMGLEGDPAARELPPQPNSTIRNHFYAFFRAEGVSENTGGRGKWGVGKTVFPRSSRINSLFGLTIRHSDRRRLLMGQTILRYHFVDGRKYAPDGMFGRQQQDDFVLPIDDSSTLEEFCRDFQLIRRDEPGLSVVVPYCHEDITVEAIVEAVGSEYFYPILTGRLKVLIDGDDHASSTLDAETLLDSLDSESVQLQGDLRTVIHLTIWAHTLPEEHIHLLVPPPLRQPPTWCESLIPKELFSQLATRFARGERLALHVPLVVQLADGADQESYFKIFLQQHLTGRGYPPVFIRNGIIIPKALERRVRGHNLLSLVVIDDLPLATFLGDAETPAHTQWSHQTQNFRGKYLQGKAILDFVRSAPRQIAEILSGARRERDRLALADFFPRPPDDDGLETSQGGQLQPRGDRTEPPETPPPPRPKAFEIEQLKDGFCIRRADRSIPCPSRLDVRVAYDRSRGNPLSKYHRADFQMESASIAKHTKGCRVGNCAGNRMIVDLLDDDFRIEVSGFDENRDVYVRALPTERSDD